MVNLPGIAQSPAIPLHGIGHSAEAAGPRVNLGNLLIFPANFIDFDQRAGLSCNNAPLGTTEFISFKFRSYLLLSSLLEQRGQGLLMEDHYDWWDIIRPFTGRLKYQWSFSIFLCPHSFDCLHFYTCKLVADIRQQQRTTCQQPAQVD